MKKIIEKIEQDRIFMNLLSGASVGFIVWLLSIFTDKLFGLSTIYYALSYFVTGGLVIGGITGLISREVRWHKKNQIK